MMRLSSRRPRSAEDLRTATGEPEGNIRRKEKRQSKREEEEKAGRKGRREEEEKGANKVHQTGP